MPRRPAPGGPDDRLRLAHMLDAAQQAVRFVKSRTRQDLDADDLFRRALIHAIQEIGEAAAKTTDFGRAKVQGVPWGQIVEMRNIIIHVYWGVNLDRVWTTAVKDLPPFIAALESALAGWPEADPHD